MYLLLRFSERSTEYTPLKLSLRKVLHVSTALAFFSDAAVAGSIHFEMHYF